MAVNNFCYTQERDADYFQEEAYDIISRIRDPEFPHTLEELNVVDQDLIKVTVDEEHKQVVYEVVWVPTTPSCGFALNIALCIRTKLERELSTKKYAKIDIFVQEGKHDNKAAIDRQVNDKERVCAAMENDDVKGAIEDLIKERPMH